jgi:hypothetical protein
MTFKYILSYSSKMKTSFIERVRTSEISHPTQRGFSLIKWQKAFEECTNISEQDINLFEEGKWIYNRLEKVRNYLSMVDLSNFNRSKVIRMVVGDLNRSASIMRGMEMVKAKDNTIFVHELIQFKVDNNEIKGPPQSPDSLLATIIDGARFPLIHISKNGGKKPFIRDLTDIEILKREKSMLLLGEYYDLIENIWVHFLWDEWVIEEKEDLYVIIPQKNYYAELRAISDYRRQFLFMEAIQHIINLWNKDISLYEKKKIASMTPEIIIEGTGKNKKYRIKKSSDTDQGPPNTFIRRLIAQELYYNDLLNEKLPNVGNISLAQLLDVWDVLYALSEAELAIFPTTSDVSKVQKLLQYAPTIRKKDIIHLISSSLQCGYEEANRAFNFLVFNPTTGHEIWNEPFICLEDDKYSFVIIPSLCGNPIRTMEKIMVRGGIDISEKGEYFEIECRRRISDALSENNLFSTCQIYPNKLWLGEGLEKEEIDIIIRINETILLGEAKCILFPTEPMEYHNYFSTLQKAVAQIKRKSSFAEQYNLQLLNLFDINCTSNSERFNIKPFVIINSPLGAGFAIEDIPITDLNILTLFLRQNKIERSVVFNPEGDKINVGSISKLPPTMSVAL